MSALPQAMVPRDPQQILAAVWQRNIPVVQQRLHVLRSAADQNNAGCLTPQLRHDAAGIAHKLAGSLGMFGYARGSEIAKLLEALLDGDEPVAAPRFQELAVQLEQILAV